MLFTAVYASPRASIRKHLQAKLDETYNGDPWLVVGNFNCVLKGEKRSPRSGSSDSFLNWVAERGLIELGFSGRKFTWNHGCNVSTRRTIQRDLGLFNDEWRWCFPKAIIKDLSHSYSDHCPLLLQQDQELGVKLGQRPFWFQVM